jgi:hypothetical protein
LSQEAVQLFWAESQFQLTKTDLLHPYLWTGLIILGARMLLTPLINAGLYFSLHHTSLNSGYRFFHGIRRLALPFLGLYALQMLIMLAPLYWVVPAVTDVFLTRFSYQSIALFLLPIVSAYLIYGYLVHLCFMYVQFSKAGGSSSWSGLFAMARSFLPALGVAATLLAISFAVTATVMTVSMIWAGFVALLLYQAYRLIHTFCKVWSIAAQYRIWRSRTDM